MSRSASSRRRAVRAVGLEVTDRAVRAALAAGGGYRTAEVELDEGVVVQGAIRDRAALSTALRVLWKEGGFRSERVVLGLAGSDVVTRQIEMADLSDADLRSALRFELDDMIPFPASEAMLDLVRIGSADNEYGSTAVRLLAVAAHREGVEELAAAARAAGLRPVGADAVSVALVRSAVALGLGVDGAARALVHVGDSSLTVVVHEAGVPRFTRRVSVQLVDDSSAADLEADLGYVERYRQRSDGGGGAGTAQLATRTDPLVAAVAGTIEYYAIVPGAVTLADLDLVGDRVRGASVEAGVREILGPSVLRNVDADAVGDANEAAVERRLDDDPVAGPFSVAIGLTLDPSDIGGGPNRLSLLPPPPALPGRRVARRAAAAAAISALLAVGGTEAVGPDAAAAIEQAEASEAATAGIQLRLPAEASGQREAAELRRTERLVESVTARRVPWDDVVAAVRASTPPGTTLLSIDARAATTNRSGRLPGLVEITGQASDQGAASAWLVALADVDGLRSPWLSSVGTLDRPGGEVGAVFTISVELDEDPAAFEGLGR